MNAPKNQSPKHATTRTDTDTHAYIKLLKELLQMDALLKHHFNNSPKFFM